MNWFDGLPWFLKEYVHRSGWTGFREIQEKAFGVLFKEDCHLLISSGTSSGKTEAAMFPVISSIYSNPPRSIGALYVGPLKALIDDQFQRLEPMLRDSYIEVTGWHGDVGIGDKNKLMETPSGILQITPESLQNMVASRSDDMDRLFGDLRFVIVDEVHAFMGSDRGLQLLCCLERLETLAGCEPRRIGLSATISDTASAEEWLSANTGRRTVTVSDGSVSERDLRILYYGFPEEADKAGRTSAANSYYRRLYDEVRGKSCIVFANSRLIAEKTARSLSKIAASRGDRTEVRVHHGSISKELRKAAEDGLMEGSGRSITVATVTLELGIDVGSLDSVVQIDTPHTCSGLVQRMGRSGRRGGPQSMRLFCREDKALWWSDLDGVSMDLVKAAAMATLVLEDGWTETERVAALPFGLLFHQTLEYLRFGAGARFSMLVSDVLSLFPFRRITKEEYAELVRHMIAEGVLMRMEDGTLLMTDKGERISSDRDFCSVFTVRREVEIRCADGPVGSIQEIPEVDDLIQLAGRVWRVMSVDPKAPSAEVEETDGSANTLWKSGVPGTDDKVMGRMREILSCDRDFPFMDDPAVRRLNESRIAARDCGMLDVHVQTEWGIKIYPWLGTRGFDTMARALRLVCNRITVYPPYRIDAYTDMDWDELIAAISSFSDEDFAEDLMHAGKPRNGKYDGYVPGRLLAKSFAADCLDLAYLDKLDGR
ncbi:MAG: DEAD/DEAH box helicase [Candidatus Methanomethylophilaceae archaeon]|nr:DEAD/DEAH box helicase [Candidatus Methanomethylophilaceae archaeon]